MNLEEFAYNIIVNDNGIYYSKTDSNIHYPENGNEHCLQIEQDSFWFNHRNNIIAANVKKYNANSIFFDIGGGNGIVAKRLQDEEVKTVIIEPGKNGALNAQKRGIKNVVCSTLEDAKFRSNSIDSIGLFDVLEHIEDDYSFLMNINKFMKNNGHIYITVPAYNFLWSNEDVDAGHFRRYSVTELNKLLKKCGYSVIYSTYIFSILPIPIFLFRSLPSRLGFNKKSNDIYKHQNEHRQKQGILNKVLGKIWNWELSRINRNKYIPMGGSCFVVGKKN